MALKTVHGGGEGHMQQNVRTNVLQKANVNILSFDECVEAVGDTEKPGRKNICALGDSVTSAGDLGKTFCNSEILV
jgi:hypothetical protein